MPTPRSNYRVTRAEQREAIAQLTAMLDRLRREHERREAERAARRGVGRSDPV